MTRVRCHAGAAGVWLFGLVIVYLAGLSLSGVMFYLFLLYLIFPVLSFIFLLAAYARFRYFEFFSTDHPTKGQEVVYRLTLANESPLPGAFVEVAFLAFGPDSAFRLEGIATALKRREVLRREYSIRFPYRGVYKVGIERLKVTDALAWFQFFGEVWYRTFYVYPRVVELDRVFPGLRHAVETSGVGEGAIDDYTLYTDIREYRPGDSVRHLAWKKYAATGQPFLKAYERTSWPGVDIYLDLRREGESGPHVLAREDCSLEILVALYHYFLKRGVPAQAHAANGRDRYDFAGSAPSAFDELYQATIAVSFAGAVSPLSLYLSDRSDRRVSASTLIIITHLFDPEIVELAAPENSGAALSAFVIVNQTGMSDEEREGQRAFLQSHPAVGRRLVFVDRPEAIKECLEL